MGQVKLGRIGLAAQHWQQRGTVVIGQFGRHAGGQIGIEPHRQHLLAQGGIIDPAAIDRGAGPVEAMIGAMPVKRLQPGTAGELVEARCARSLSARCGVKARFQLRLGQQVIEIDPGRPRRTGNRALDIRTRWRGGGNDIGLAHAKPPLQASAGGGSARGVPIQLVGIL